MIVLVTRLFVVYAPSRAMSLEDSLNLIVEALMRTSTCNKASSTCTIGSSRSKLGMSPSFGVAAEEIISSYGASSLKGLQAGPSWWRENLFVVPPDNTNYSFYSSNIFNSADRRGLKSILAADQNHFFSALPSPPRAPPRCPHVQVPKSYPLPGSG